MTRRDKPGVRSDHILLSETDNVRGRDRTRAPFLHRWAAGLFLLLVFLPAWSCAPHPIRTFETAGLRTRAYVDALSRATRHVALYHHFETRVVLDATLWTAEFQHAWLDEYARVYRLNAEKRSELEDDLGRRLKDRVRIRLCIHSSTRAESDLSPARGLWRVVLVDDRGDEAEALEIHRIGDAELLEKRFFPYISKLGRTYDLYFPDTSPSGKPLLESHTLALRLSGVPGSAQVQWASPSPR